MFQFENVEKSYGGERLFAGLNWQIPDEATVGLVGPNGAGKSTLFRLLTGEESPDGGRVVRPRDATVGHLPQEVAIEYGGTVLDVVLDGRAELVEMEAQLESLERRLSDGSSEQVAELYAEVQDRFRREGGYEMRSKAHEIAAGMGFDSQACSRPIDSFSGGWKMRALLARLLLSEPDLLLLDEPTNHLDVESIEWLEQFLQQYSGTVVTISHDRYFLNRLVDSIAELHGSQIAIYHGDYDYYLQERQRRREQLLEKKEQQDKEIARIQEFIDRFRYQASKASLVQSRVKQLEKMETIEVPPDHSSSINFEFPTPPRVGKTVLQARDVDKSYGTNKVYDGVDFLLRRGDRVAFVGPNGAGKSTLLKILAGRVEPDSGSVEIGHNVEIAYFAQHSVDQLDLTRTVLDEMEAAASYESAPKIRSILGAFLFSGDDVHKQISVLSGGEKSRLALAKLLLEPAGCLLLDEPTNHLDISSRRVLEHALNHFPGAFCVVSHDRYFLEEVVNRVIHIEDGRLRDYPGSYEEYRWHRGRDESEGDSGAPDDDATTVSQTTREPKLSRKEMRRQLAALRREKSAELGALQGEVEQLLERIETMETALEQLEARLADPETHRQGGQRIVELQKEHGRIEAQLSEAMQEWEEKGGRLEELENKYAAREAAIRNG